MNTGDGVSLRRDGCRAALRLQRTRRFRWVAIRVFFARMVHSVIAAVQWLVNAVVYRLDYARRFRCALPGVLCLVVGQWEHCHQVWSPCLAFCVWLSGSGITVTRCGVRHKADVMSCTHLSFARAQAEVDLRLALSHAPWGVPKAAPVAVNNYL